MTSTFVLPHAAHFKRLRDVLGRGRVLYEPRAGAGGVEWRRVADSEPFDWDAGPALTGVKRFFFPPRETLLRWDGAAIDEAVPDTAPFALLGLRACDLAAIAYTDRFFAGDAWYEARRARAFLVGVNCLAACKGGFCVDVDAGPFARTAFDLALTRLPDGRFVVECGTSVGRELLLGCWPDLAVVDDHTRAAMATLEAAARASFPARGHVARAVTRVNAAAGGTAVGQQEWDGIGVSCLACTGCTTVCPTCTCFAVVDEGDGERGERVRIWDSCLLEGFQREASGHHPAPSAGDRVRRFWTHKLSREFDAACGRLGCVGCGRCDVTCPGAIGASRVLGAIGTEGAA